MTATKRIRFFTGPPGIGKTTVLLKTIEHLKDYGLLVGGFISSEIRVGDKRVGFGLKDILTGRVGILAHVDQSIGPRIGQYRVNLSDLDAIGVNAIESALASANIIAVDEVGPMEILSEGFRGSVYRALRSRKAILGILHFRIQHVLAEDIRKHSECTVIEVTLSNRNELPQIVSSDLFPFVSEKL